MRTLSLIILGCGLLAACAPAAGMAQTHSSAPVINKRDHTEARPYRENADAMADVDAALARAAVSGKKALFVMGANWCHDSRSLAGRFEALEFAGLLADNYELIYVTAGVNPGQKNMNQDVSARFGVTAIEGTPTVFITNSEGTVLNAESAGYWRQADSIPADLVLAYFSYYAGK